MIKGEREIDIVCLHIPAPLGQDGPGVSPPFLVSSTYTKAQRSRQSQALRQLFRRNGAAKDDAGDFFGGNFLNIHELYIRYRRHVYYVKYVYIYIYDIKH